MINNMQCLKIVVTMVVVGCALHAQPEPDSAIIGVRGNWRKKRAWVKEAQVAQEQIIQDAASAKKARTQFATAFDEVDKKVNEFYSAKGFARGKIGTLIEDIKIDVAKDKERRIAHARKRSESDDAPINFYDVHVEAIEQEVKRFERDFEQFNLDMKSIAALDASLQERIKAVDKHIKEASDLSAQSSKKLEEMWWIIDDQKAADSFYEIQDFADKVSSIKKYLQDTLFADFKKVIQTLEKQMEQVDTQITGIEQRGFIVSHRAQRMKQKEVGDVLAVVSEEVANEADEPVVPRRRRKKQESWGEYFMAAPMRLISAAQEVVVATFSYISSFLGIHKKRVRRTMTPTDSE